jgi:hypothetical protein
MKDLLIAGKIMKFLINPDIEIASKPEKGGKNKGSERVKDKKNKVPLRKNE